MPCEKTAYLFEPMLGGIVSARLLDAVRRAADMLPSLEEIRLRRGCASEVVGDGRAAPLREGAVLYEVNEDDINATLSAVTAGALYRYGEGLACGGFSVPGGVRVGVCGIRAAGGGERAQLREIRSLCLRFPSHAALPAADSLLAALHGRARTEISNRKSQGAGELQSSLLFGPPGCGKTTALRVLIRTLTKGASHRRAAVIDSGGELFGSFDHHACHADFFADTSKYDAIVRAMRYFSPQIIFCDEIGDEHDCAALLKTQHSGAVLIATAHGESLEGLLKRPGIAELKRAGVFRSFIRISRGQGDMLEAVPQEDETP